MAFYDHLSSQRFRSGSYNVFYNNCIEFARVMSYRLVGENIPEKYSMIPAKKVVTAAGCAFLPYVTLIEYKISPGKAPITEAIREGVSEFANIVVDKTPLGLPITVIGAATTSAVSATRVAAKTTVDVASAVFETTGEAVCDVVESFSEVTTSAVKFFSDLF